MIFCFRFIPSCFFVMFRLEWSTDQSCFHQSVFTIKLLVRSWVIIFFWKREYQPKPAEAGRERTHLGTVSCEWDINYYFFDTPWSPKPNKRASSQPLGKPVVRTGGNPSELQKPGHARCLRHGPGVPGHVLGHSGPEVCFIKRWVPPPPVSKQGGGGRSRPRGRRVLVSHSP